MPKIGYRLLAALVALILLGAAGEPPDRLRRGINITHWFRYPPNQDPAALRNYLSDAAEAELRHAGFDFVRIPVQPSLLAAREALADAVARIQRHGLAVVIALYAPEWHLETNPGDRAKLFAAWHALAPALRRLDARLTYLEILNEPVFAGDPGAWARLQHQVLLAIRSELPTNTIVLSGADWGSIGGLLSLSPEADPNVLYSFHLYEPAELTALGAYRPAVDAAAMTHLPFPVSDQAACQLIADSTHDWPTAELMRFYCLQRWDEARLAGRIAEAADWGRRHHVAVFAGEFGASDRLNPAARLAWLSTVRETCERQGIAWSLWGYDDSMGLALRPTTERRAVDPAIMQALGLVPFK